MVKLVVVQCYFHFIIFILNLKSSIQEEEEDYGFKLSDVRKRMYDPRDLDYIEFINGQQISASNPPDLSSTPLKLLKTAATSSISSAKEKTTPQPQGGQEIPHPASKRQFEEIDSLGFKEAKDETPPDSIDKSKVQRISDLIRSSH